MGVTQSKAKGPRAKRTAAGGIASDGVIPMECGSVRYRALRAGKVLPSKGGASY